MTTTTIIRNAVKRFNDMIGHKYTIRAEAGKLVITSDESDRFSGVLLRDLACISALYNLGWSVYSKGESIFVRIDSHE